MRLCRPNANFVFLWFLIKPIGVGSKYVFLERKISVAILESTQSEALWNKIAGGPCIEIKGLNGGPPFSEKNGKKISSPLQL
jgi:hypothetical protein